MDFSPISAKPLNFLPPMGGKNQLDHVHLLLRQYYADPRRSKTNIIPFGCFRVHVQRGLVIFHPLAEIWACFTVGNTLFRDFWFRHTSPIMYINGIIGHAIINNNASMTLSHPKFCAESVFEVGWVWFLVDLSVMTENNSIRAKLSLPTVAEPTKYQLHCSKYDASRRYTVLHDGWTK